MDFLFTHKGSAREQTHKFLDTILPEFALFRGNKHSLPELFGVIQLLLDILGEKWSLGCNKYCHPSFFSYHKGR